MQFSDIGVMIGPYLHVYKCVGTLLVMVIHLPSNCLSNCGGTWHEANNECGKFGRRFANKDHQPITHNPYNPPPLPTSLSPAQIRPSMPCGWPACPGCSVRSPLASVLGVGARSSPAPTANSSPALKSLIRG